MRSANIFWTTEERKKEKNENEMKHGIINIEWGNCSCVPMFNFATYLLNEEMRRVFIKKYNYITAYCIKKDSHVIMLIWVNITFFMLSSPSSGVLYILPI